MRILLVEDDESIIQILTATLSEQNYVVDVAMDGEAGWQLVETYVYNLVLLDVMLPKLDGISFCQRLRSRRSAVLVMLLTARKTPADKLAGLDSGADDYMVKPFHPAELVARVRALLRRGTTAPSAVLTCGNLRLDPSAREVTCEGQALHLSRKEYLLLELFLHSQQQVFSRGRYCRSPLVLWRRSARRGYCEVSHQKSAAQAEQGRRSGSGRNALRSGLSHQSGLWSSRGGASAASRLSRPRRFKQRCTAFGSGQEDCALNEWQFWSKRSPLCKPQPWMQRSISSLPERPQAVRFSRNVRVRYGLSVGPEN
jgi:DNA-binding response OmpR family regulator